MRAAAAAKKEMVRDTKCVGCIAKRHGLVWCALRVTLQHFGDTLCRLAATIATVVVVK